MSLKVRLAAASPFSTVAVQHVPERPRRARLIIADASIDQDVMARRLDDETLDAQHQPVIRIDECRLKPSAVLVKQFFGKRRKKSECLEESALLLDDRMNRDVVQRQRLSHDGSTQPKDRDRRFGRQYHKPEFALSSLQGTKQSRKDLLPAVFLAFLGQPLHGGDALAFGGREHDDALRRAAGDTDTVHGTADELAAVGNQHDLIAFLDRQ